MGGSEFKSSLRVSLRALSSRNYRLFFAGQAVSLTGSWMQNIAMSWLVYRLTDSVFLLGATAFAGDICCFFLMPLAGTMADRHSRKKIIVVAQSLAMLHAFGMAFLVFFGLIQVWHVFLLAIFLGIVQAFEIPTRQSFVIQLIEKKDDLPNAIALNSSIFNGARLIGPSLAGLMIAATGEVFCFLLNGLSYIAVIVALLSMRIASEPQRKKKKSVYRELREGFSYAIGFSPLRNILLMIILASMMGLSYSVMLPVLAREILHGGPQTFGFLMGAAGLGAFFGAVLLAFRRTVSGLSAWIPTAGVIAGSALIWLSFSSSFQLSMVIMVFVGFGMMNLTVSSNTIVQTIVDDDKRGRIMGLYFTALRGGMPIGTLLAGTLSEHIGVVHTLAIFGASLIAGSLLFAKQLPAFHREVRPIFAKKDLIVENAPKA
jgi:MFS family permease